MQPILELLSPTLVDRILDEAFQLLREPGVMVQSPEGRELLQDAGAAVDSGSEVVRFPEVILRRALETVPREFSLFTREGAPAVHYGGNVVQFDPGSSGVNVLDPETGQHRPAVTPDLV